ncbi:MAG TPA: hypothetical protein VN730_04190 [Steroidobacteraceae bacterium]|nr:hypothetical protein [Steroidobacteraceae bacterium]
MSEKQRHPAPSDRRPAIWPWFAMPAAALALFWTLHTVRHTVRHPGGMTQPPARAPAASAASAQ